MKLSRFVPICFMFSGCAGVPALYSPPTAADGISQRQEMLLAPKVRDVVDEVACELARAKATGALKDRYAFSNANTNTTTVTNGLNQLSTVGGASAAYDSNGNLTTDPISAKTYAYDAANRLTSSSGAPAPASATIRPTGSTPTIPAA